MWEVIKKNPISSFAVGLVMVTEAILSVITFRLIDILTSPEWCAKAIQAERITPGNTFVGLTSCTAMSMEQVKAVATALLIAVSSNSFVLLVLVVVVVAGARASWKLSTSGVEGSVGREPPTPVTVVNPPSSPVPTTEAPKATATPPAQPAPPDPRPAQ